MTQAVEPSGGAADAVPPRGLARAAAAVDAAVGRVEQWLVTIIALIMTGTVFLDIVYRSFASPESQLAQKLLKILVFCGLPPSETLYATLRDVGTPIILTLLAFLAGWAVLASAGRQQGTRRPAWQGLLAGVASVAGSYAFVRFVVAVPSRWVCLALLIVGCVAYLAYALRRGEWIGAILTLVIGAAGGWLCRLLPPQYIWSQELSLILLAWLAFIGASMATRATKHIQVEAFAKLIPTPLRPWMHALGLLVTTAFCVYITLLAWHHVFGPRGDFGSGEVRPATGMPGWTVIMSVLVAFSLMSLRFAARTVDACLHPKAPTAEIVH